MNPQTTKYASINTITNGKQTVQSTTVATALVPTAQGCLQVIITAIDNNVGPVYIGGKGLTVGQGIMIEPTNTTPVPLLINDVSKVYIIGANLNDGVSFAYLN